VSRLQRSTAVEVQVPATSANLGPGFDCLGLALGIHDRLIAMITDDPGVRVDIEGEGADVLPTDESHLVIRAAARGFDAMGMAMPGLIVRCANAIPQGRGLGSSAAAIIAGLLIARGLVIDGADELSDADILDIATEMEGHPDNVAAALLGGFTTAWLEAESAGSVHTAAVVRPVHPGIAAIVAVPAQPVATAKARGLLGDTVTRESAVFNIGRASALSHALAADPSMLFTSTEDRLHQDERAQVYPQSHALLTQWRAQGLPAVISGAGPTVLVLTDHPDRAGRIMAAACADGWQVRAVEIDLDGARSITRPLGN
jgi:homoserine kinase